MGEAKRRNLQGLPPKGPKRAPASGAGEEGERINAWLPLSRRQADQFVSVTTRGAWIGIAALAVFWVTVRFIGPAAGWWSLADG
jgi:hypothetical protein